MKKGKPLVITTANVHEIFEDLKKKIGDVPGPMYLLVPVKPPKNLWERFQFWMGWKTPEIDLPLTPGPLFPVPPAVLPRPRIEKCPQTDKYMFTRQQAEAKRDELLARKREQYLRIYCCEYCNTWHLTHKRRHKW